ncbi:MAG: SCO family protein [Steroidobacter sp.]
MSRLHYPGMVLLCMLSCGLIPRSQAEELKAGVFTPARPAPDFVLKGSNGSDLELSKYHGKIVVLGFGYSSCTNVCPITLAVLAQAYRQLGTQASQVQVLYLTVDPARDTQARLKQYLTAFDPSFIGGTGTDEEMSAVRKLYGVTAEKHEFGKDYVIAHSSFIFLIDRNGKIRAIMPFGHKAADYVHDLKLLLKE